MRNNVISFLAMLLAFVLIAGAGFHWTVNRVYVPEGQSLMLRYKGPLVFGARDYAKTGHWAEEGEIGILAKLRGPGRHFYWPIWWERTLVDDVVVKPGEVGLVTCKLGDDLPSREFLVEGDIGNTKHKGILRKVLHPGRYRINPYGYGVQVVKILQEDSGKGNKYSGWVEIPTGYVGVVTNMADNRATGAKAGVQSNVLPPGIYPTNGREQQIDIVEVGYRHMTIQATKLRDASGKLIVDDEGEPQITNDLTGIEFPSSDGFEIQMDFTAVWGLMPDQAPHAIRTIGNVEAVEKKIVAPQVDSICRNNGSKYKAVELLVGTDREKFQESIVEQFQRVLKEKEITLLYGLVRHIYIPREVRKPIQTAFIADELKLTREQEQLTAKEEGTLKQAEKQVSLEKRRVEVDTIRLVAAKKAEGNRKAEGIRAETERLSAAIIKETAELLAQAAEIKGEAENRGKQMVEEAKAERFKLAVDAFGSPEAYNNWIFATGLPDDIKLNLIYAGQGTLWTDVNKADGSFGIRATMPLDPGKK